MTQTSMEDGSWIKEEISQVNFNDIRLDRRFKSLAAELAARPSFPINQATSDWAAAKAAYRFFDNEKIQAEKILEPHYLSTQLRMQGHQHIFIVQDSSTIDFSRHKKTTGLGHLTTTEDGYDFMGLNFHSALALSEKGLPLGLIHQEIWARKKHKKGFNKALVPLEKKESFKWLKALRSTIKRTGEGPEVTMLCDREGDIYELFSEAMDAGIECVVRMRHDRVLYEEDGADYIRVLDLLGVTQSSGRMNVDIPSSGKRAARIACVEVRFTPITFASAPRGIRINYYKNRLDLDLYAVELRETKSPKGVEPLHWVLITTHDVRSFKRAYEIGHFYKMRWNIELYFKSLKTGCNVEACRLNEAGKLIRYVSLLSIVAWRIMWMSFINRSHPSLSCEVALTPGEWKALWIKKHKKEIKAGLTKPVPPSSPPTLGEAIRWIAMQGGFLGRKNDGEPGQITVWRGWLELAPAAEMWELLNGA